jgi:hypothetical protein
MSTPTAPLQARAYALHDFIRPIIDEAVAATGPRRAELDAQLRPVLVSGILPSLLHGPLTQT